MGAAEVVDELRVEWPASETVQVFKNVPVNQAYRIVEEATELEIIPIQAIALPQALTAQEDSKVSSSGSPR